MVKVDLNAIVVLYFAAISIGLFTAVVLFISPKNKSANRLLSFLVLAITGWITDAFLRASGLYGQFATLYFLPIYYSFAFGPLIYFYVQSITNRNFRLRRKHIPHFIPVLLQAGFYWLATFQSYEVKYKLWFQVHQPYTYRVEYDGTWFSLVTYLLLAVRHLARYQSWLKDNYSNTSRTMLRWLKASLAVLMVVCIGWAFEAYLRDFRNIYYVYDISTALLCGVIYLMSILGLKQSGLDVQFEDVKPVSKPTKGVVDENLLKRIEEAMNREKLYLNPELTLSELATHLRSNPKAVSFNINASFGKTFNSYVNGFRVEETKRRLQTDAGKFTLLAIAFESGFNSKTSFNRVFKELTGKSPSEYVKH